MSDLVVDRERFRCIKVLQRLAASVVPTCVYIGGPHKTGTSALAALVEEMGFENPARITNPGEHGTGAAGPYWTRECAVARTLNLRVHTAESDDVESPVKPVRGYLAILREALGPRLVIKAPDLIRSPLVWVDATVELGMVPVFLLCWRDRKSLERSWRAAKWTRRKLELNPGAIDNAVRLVSATYKQLGARGVDVELIEALSALPLSRRRLLAERSEPLTSNQKLGPRTPGVSADRPNRAPHP